MELTALQQRVLLAFSPTSVAVPTVELDGTVTRTAGGKEERGTVAFQAGDSGAEQETWTLASGNRILSKTSFADGRGCSTKTGAKETFDDAANCFRTVPWFLPALALRLVLPGSATAQDVSTDMDRQAGLTRLRFTPVARDVSRFKARIAKEYAAMLAASTADVLIDTKTALPQRLEYHHALNSDPSAFIETAVDYSEYRLESGLMVPHHIRRYLQRTQESDIQISSLTLR